MAFSDRCLLSFTCEETQTHVDEDTIKSELVIPSLQLPDRGTYTCTANNFIGNSSVSILVNATGPESSSPFSSVFPLPSAEENIYIDIRIAKQTVYGITLEWYATTQNPSETWYTIHFGKYDDAKKEMIYIGPGINSYSVTDLLPATKYEVCIALKNQSPRRGQCVVFVTGSDISELEQREKLIHIVVIVFSCFDRCSEVCKRRRHAEKGGKSGERQGTFDSLQAGSDEGLCRDSSEDKRRRRRSDDRIQKARADQRTTAGLY
ncbi:LRIT2 protein, partial [Atractosteus spatula]|nr:LRIT2 protein [Atractosteus spatula]